MTGEALTKERLKLIEKIYLLETRLGDKFSYMTLEPFKFDSSSVIEVQQAAKKIADFIGLKQQTFVITYSTQKRNVGGHIDINYANDVFIEIDEKFKSNYAMVLALLAHEICHKYLHVNNIELSPVIENEILTDITTVYTGLGKLSLNGCEHSTSSSTYSGDKTSTKITTEKVGYLDRKQFAFVYRVISEMKRIPKVQMHKGLNPDVSSFVSNIEHTDAIFFTGNYFSKDKSDKLLTDFLKEVDETQIDFARLIKYIQVIQSHADSISSDINIKHNSFHSYRKSVLEKLAAPTNSEIANDAFNYIRNVWLMLEFKEIRTAVATKEEEVEKAKKSLTNIVETLKTVYPHYFTVQHSQYLLTFNCPLCKHRMKISRNVLANVTCPKCNYSFMVDAANQVEFSNNNTPLSEVYARDSGMLYKMGATISNLKTYLVSFFKK